MFQWLVRLLANVVTNQSLNRMDLHSLGNECSRFMVRCLLTSLIATVWGPIIFPDNTTDNLEVLVSNAKLGCMVLEKSLTYYISNPTSALSLQYVQCIKEAPPVPPKHLKPKLANRNSEYRRSAAPNSSVFR